VGNLTLLWRPQVHFLGGYFKLFDLGGTIGLAGMAMMLVFFTAQNTVRLYREDRVGKEKIAREKVSGEKIGDASTAEKSIAQ
jgi:hypothetical protein